VDVSLPRTVPANLQIIGADRQHIRCASILASKPFPWLVDRNQHPGLVPARDLLRKRIEDAADERLASMDGLGSCRLGGHVESSQINAPCSAPFPPEKKLLLRKRSPSGFAVRPRSRKETAQFKQTPPRSEDSVANASPVLELRRGRVHFLHSRRSFASALL